MVGRPGAAPPSTRRRACSTSTPTMCPISPSSSPMRRAGTISRATPITTTSMAIRGTKDEKFHAYDKATGKLLWDVKLPAGGYATPSTYMVNGRQYVVIAAGGGGKLRTASGDAFIAFALPPTTTASSTKSDRTK